MNGVALYMRSSKDRSDVSIDAQRRALTDVAVSREFTVVAQFSDAVESGKDDHRPGFQSLMVALRNPRRGWTTVLVHDTSRIARRRQIALFFEDACQKAGVSVIYKNMPDSDPVTDTQLRGIMQALDEWHSLTSKQKGLAGMAENVRRGFRAGGRAPLGYCLKKLTTDTVRDGALVTKSVLELDPDSAPKVRAYLLARAAGIQAKLAAAQANLEISASSRVGLEWNALTYAGHTVWNVNAERDGGTYVRGNKRRARAAWVIQKDTHPALIDEDSAEGLLARLEANARSRSSKGRAHGNSLLSGLLVAPDGTPWHSEGLEYRLRRSNRSTKAETIEKAVLAQVRSDLASPKMAKSLLERMRKTLLGNEDTGRLETLQREEADLRGRISGLVEMAESMTEPAPLVRRIDELEKDRVGLALEVTRLHQEQKQARGARRLTEQDVERLLQRVVDDQGHDARSLLLAVVEKVEFDPACKEGVIHYRIATDRAGLVGSGDLMASPRGFEPRCPP